MVDKRSDDASGEPRLTEAMIEKFRQVGIRLDRAGRFWHEGREVIHPRLRKALLKWIDRLDDGRAILRLDDTRYAYLEVEDAHLLVVSARWQGDRVMLALNDGSEEELAYSSLRVGDDDALYCSVRGGRLDARMTTAAYYVVAERVSAADDDSFVLRAAGHEFPISRFSRR